MSTVTSLMGELRARGIKPKQALGQNFLIDPVHRERIVSAARLTQADLVLEIGPGPGVLTELLAQRAGHVVAVELDARLIPLLRERFAGQPHVTIVHGDILELDLAQLMAPPSAAPAPSDEAQSSSYKVVANLPYYITGAVLRRLLEATSPPELMVLTVQQEVAERVVSDPPRSSLLAVSVQYYAVTEVVGRIPGGAFYPVPKVSSAVLRLLRRQQHAVADVDTDAFFRVVRAGFRQPRKQLRNTLAAGLALSPSRAEQLLAAAGIDHHRRAETLWMAEWGALARVLADSSS